MSFPNLDTLAALSDELTQLELRIARRADELAARGFGCTRLKLSCWLQAEEELLGRLLGIEDKRFVPERRTA
jgi:hypothetical protein